MDQYSHCPWVWNCGKSFFFNRFTIRTTVFMNDLSYQLVTKTTASLFCLSLPW